MRISFGASVNKAATASNLLSAANFSFFFVVSFRSINEWSFYICVCVKCFVLHAYAFIHSTESILKNNRNGFQIYLHSIKFVCYKLTSLTILIRLNQSNRISITHPNIYYIHIENWKHKSTTKLLLRNHLNLSWVIFDVFLQIFK